MKVFFAHISLLLAATIFTNCGNDQMVANGEIPNADAKRDPQKGETSGGTTGGDAQSGITTGPAGDGGNIPPSTSSSSSSSGGTSSSSSGGGTSSSSSGGGTSSSSSGGGTSSSSSGGGTSSSSSGGSSSGGETGSSGTTSGGTSGNVCGEASFIVLHETAAKSVDVTGNGKIITRGDIYVDSSAANATVLTGNAKIYAAHFFLTGDYVLTGNSKLLSPDGGAPTIYLGSPPIADPLRDLDPPDRASLPIQSTSRLHHSNGDLTLNPGIYQGGIVASGASILHLQPGIYFLEGGGLELSGKSKIEGKNVLIYTSGVGNMSVSGQAVMNLTPHSEGDYQGITLFFDREAESHLKLTGNGASHLIGAVYAAKSNVNLSGNGSGVFGSLYISRTLTVTGNGDLKVNWSGTPPLECPR